MNNNNIQNAANFQQQGNFFLNSNNQNTNQTNGLDIQVGLISNNSFRFFQNQLSPSSNTSNGNLSTHFNQNLPSYNQNALSYNQNAPSYNQNASSYNQNIPSYNQNLPSYNQNLPSYNQNAPSYFNENSPLLGSSNSNTSSYQFLPPYYNQRSFPQDHQVQNQSFNFSYPSQNKNYNPSKESKFTENSTHSFLNNPDIFYQSPSPQTNFNRITLSATPERTNDDEVSVSIPRPKSSFTRDTLAKQLAADTIPLVPRSKYKEERYAAALKDECYINKAYSIEANVELIHYLDSLNKKFIVGLSKEEAATLVKDRWKSKTTLLEVLVLHDLGYVFKFDEKEGHYKAEKREYPKRSSIDGFEEKLKSKDSAQFQAFWNTKLEDEQTRLELIVRLLNVENEMTEVKTPSQSAPTTPFQERNSTPSQERNLTSTPLSGWSTSNSKLSLGAIGRNYAAQQQGSPSPLTSPSAAQQNTPKNISTAYRPGSFRMLKEAQNTQGTPNP